MKYRGTKESVLQSFIFNIVCFIIFLGIGFYHMLPAYTDLAIKKSELVELSNSYDQLSIEGLSFEEFTASHSSLGTLQGLDKNTYLSSVLKSFSKQEYEEFFINKEASRYDTFLDKSIKDLQGKKSELDDQGINEGVKKILPYYSKDSSLDDGALTDFKFVNYMENLLHMFSLKYSGSLGIGNLEVVEDFESKKDVKQQLRKQLEGKIYSGTNRLELIGKKKNIVNFIHYIENVGQVYIDEDGGVGIKQVDKLGSYTDINKIFAQNSLEKSQLSNGENSDTSTSLIESDLEKSEGSDGENLDTSTSLIKSSLGKSEGSNGESPDISTPSVERSIYNNLIMEIKSITFSEYIDSSDAATPERYTDLVSFIKKTQGNRKYGVEIEIKFYIRGLPRYKLEEFSKAVILDHKNLVQAINQGINFVGKNKVLLKSNNAINAINNLEKFSKYISGIDKPMKLLTKKLAKKEDLVNIHKQAVEYNSIFTVMKSQLQIDLKSLSKGLYESNKELLGTKD